MATGSIELRLHRQAFRLTLRVLAVACSWCSSAAGSEILITRGSFDMQVGAYNAGVMAFEGERGFTFEGYVYHANVRVCGDGPCSTGERVSLSGGSGGLDVFGEATLDGVNYRLGCVADYCDAMDVRFLGSVTLPPLSESATVKAPFVFSGVLWGPEEGVALGGSGAATIKLVPDINRPGAWRVTRVVYEFGDRLPPPWVVTDIGGLSTASRTSALTDTFIVAGDGEDIWGTTDAFRFVYQRLAAGGSVTAHVAGANSFPMEEDPHDPHEAPSEFAKAGVMMRASTDPGSASVILDVKPDGGLEFMVRYASGESTHFIAGAAAAPHDVLLRLSRKDGQIMAAHSPDGVTWTTLGTVVVPFASDEILTGLAVTSHERDSLYAALFDDVSVIGERANLLVNGDFEAYDPPALGPPGWISDDALRQSPAKSETHQPRSGQKNGACWTPEYFDCGIYQEVVAPATGTYRYRIYASADREGGVVGANVNGGTATSKPVHARSCGDFRPYNMTFTANAGDVIRVWMYSPARPGYVVIDDASLALAGAE